MFARQQKLCIAIPMDDPPSQYLQQPLLEKSNEKSTKVLQHEKTEEDPSLVVVGSPVLAHIQSYSFLLGLMIAFFIESSALSAHVLALARFGVYFDPGMVTLFSIMWTCFTSVLLFITAFATLHFIRNLITLPYHLSADPSEENETIIWHIECSFGLGALIGVNSASVIMGFLLGVDGHIKYYSGGMLVGVMMLSLIFQFYAAKKHRQVTRFGSLATKTNKVAPTSSSASKHGTIDPVETQCGEESDALCLIV
jgi:hypothetical protein